jgi:deoxycytidylate deaminase
MNNRTLHRAIDIAKALHPTVRNMRSCHVAFLVFKGKIIRIGFNSNKTHPFNLQHPYYHKDKSESGIHAELAVCLKMQQDDLSKYSMIVIRHNLSMELAISRPCIGCQSVIRQFGITDVYYSTSYGIEKM